ncbi:MAG: pitrilysin family protein [Bacteroidota bacterium]
MPTKSNRTSFARTSPSRYRKTTLANGVRIVTESLPYVRSVSIGVWADVGSRDESADRNGLSHFLEHMVFKGTRKRNVKDIAQSLESLGGYLNAFTTKEHTCFYARVLDAHVPEAMDVLSDLVLNAKFDKKELEKEKQVVIEELRNDEDDPEDVIHDYFEKSLFPNHSLGNPIIGTEENLRRFQRADLCEHAEEYYRPDSLIVAAAGNVDHHRVVRLAERHFQGLLPKKNARVREVGPSMTGQSGVREFKKPIQQSHICLGTVGYSMKHRDRHALLVLNGLLGEGMSSRLYQTIRERYGFAYTVYSFVSFMSDTGVFGVYIGTDQKNIDRSVELARAELLRLTERNVSAAEVERTKSQIKGNLMLSLESMSNRMMRLGGSELYLNANQSVDEVLKNIDGVTPASIRRVARELFSLDRFSTIIVRPSGKS